MKADDFFGYCLGIAVVLLCLALLLVVIKAT